MRPLCALAFLLACVTALAQDDLVLYLPFDSSCSPALGTARVGMQGVADLGFAPGIFGEAVNLQADCRYDIGDAFPIASGTFAVWVSPHWPADDPAGHYLMCVYGSPDDPDPWIRDRWSIFAGGGKLRFSIFTHVGGRYHEISAPADDWEPGSWHHVAATWRGVNSGAADAVMRLYLDGKLAAEAVDLPLDVQQPSSLLDIGRDSDASPDYGDALFDEVFLYNRALQAEEIASAVEMVRSGNLPRPEPRAARAGVVAGWLDPTRPYRVVLATPPLERDRTDACFEVPLDFGPDLRQLGVAGTADATSLRLVELPDAPEGRGGNDLRLTVDGSRVTWLAPDVTAAGAVRRFALYFSALEYQRIAPLVVAPGRPRADALPSAPGIPTDYATTAYDDAWDFDEGDTEDIDRFGDKDEYFRDVRVEDGCLKASVSQDPYLIWGTMWGPEDQGQRKVRIDVEEFGILEMRIRQSVPSAQWVIFGRVAGSDRLLRYPFRVTGEGWQTVRIDLLHEARWGGVLSAFRIDPTEEVDADIAIDWVRLLSVRAAQREPVETSGRPSGVPAAIVLSVPDRNPQVGREQLISIRVTAVNGEPVSGQPLHVRLAEGSGGELKVQQQPMLRTDQAGLRGLTDNDGQVWLTYTASRAAGAAADTMLAATEFPAVEAKRLVIDTKPGPPHHYRVLSDGVTIFREADAPFDIPAQIVDEFGNPLPVSGRKLKWAAEDGEVRAETGATDDLGKAQAAFTPDMARRWVYRVRVSDDRGLTGESGPICVLPKGPPPNPVRLLGNGYFATGDGKPYLPLGGFYINWVGLPDAETGEEGRVLRSFTDATEEETLHWLDFLRRQGVTTLRLMLRTHTDRGLEPMDVGGRVNRPLFARALRLMDLARRFDLRFLLVIHDDYNKPVYCNLDNLRKFSLPQFAGEDLDALPPYQRRFIRDQRVLRLAHEKYTDPDAMACEDDYAREIISYVKDNPQVFGYELENEMVDCPREWAQHAVEVIRSVDPDTPICASHGGGGIHTADPLWWTTETPIDFYTYHLYPIGSTDEVTDYGAAVCRLARYGRMAGVCFLGESSGDEFSRYPAERTNDRRYIMRDIIWMSLINGNPGCFFWNARGYEVEQFRLASEVVGRIDWTTWQRDKPETGIVVGHPLADDKYYRSPEGGADRAMMGRHCQHFLSAGVDFDFTMQAPGYAETTDLRNFAPPEPAQRQFGISEGFQLASLTRSDVAEGLLYIRNFAGVRPWQVPGRGTMWLRERQPAPLRVELNLPHDTISLRWWDLDSGESRDVSGAGTDTLALGATGHDFAVHWTKG